MTPRQKKYLIRKVLLWLIWLMLLIHVPHFIESVYLQALTTTATTIYALHRCRWLMKADTLRQIQEVNTSDTQA